MRLTLIAINFFLLLTLVNAVLYRENVLFFHRHAFAALQLPQGLQRRYERDTAFWREAEAGVLTIVVFGGIAYIRRMTSQAKRADGAAAAHL